MIARFAVVVATLLAASLACAETLSPDAARRFVAGKLFAFNCFDGSRGTGRIYGDGSVIGGIIGLRLQPDLLSLLAQGRHIVLVTGTKYYGSHLGPFKTPARESDPRHLPPDYYFDQIDWLTDFQRGKSWDWVELRPQTLCGFAPGTPMSLAPAAILSAA